MEVRTKQGAFSWNELLANDVEGAKSFYTQLFGWTSEDMDTPGGNYTVFKADGEQVGGLMQLPAEAKQMGALPHWGAYVTVDDVNETVKKAEALGATVLVPPMVAAGVGTFSTVQDPQGAVISFIKYEQS